MAVFCYYGVKLLHTHYLDTSYASVAKEDTDGVGQMFRDPGRGDIMGPSVRTSKDLRRNLHHLAAVNRYGCYA